MVRQIFATRGLLLATFVIGDIHGRADLVQSLLPKLEIAESDDVVFLGDYIDRGPRQIGESSMLCCTSLTRHPAELLSCLVTMSNGCCDH